MAYDAKYVHGMGWTLVVLGSLSIILGIAADAAFGSMAAFAIFHYMSAPIWSGIFVVITGVLGICSGKKPTSKGLIVSFMILGIFTILSAVCCFSLAIVGTFVDGRYCGYGGDCRSAIIALHVVNVLLSLAEIVMGFTAAIMSCCGLAAPSTNVAPTVVYTQGPNMPAGQGAYIIMQTGVPGQGVPYTTVAAAGGMPQQQVFIAQHPYPTAAPVQGYYAGQAPPPYVQQSNIGAAPGYVPAAAYTPAAGYAPAAPPAGSKSQPPA